MIDLKDWQDGTTIYWYGEDDRKSGVALWTCSGGHFGPDKFGMPIGLQSGDASR